MFATLAFCLAYVLLAGRLPWADGLSELRVMLTKVQGGLEPLANVRKDLPTSLCEAVHALLAVQP